MNIIIEHINIQGLAEVDFIYPFNVDKSLHPFNSQGKFASKKKVRNHLDLKCA